MNRSTLVVCLMILFSSAANAHTVVKTTTVSNKAPERALFKNSLVIVLESKSAFVINENECQQLNTTAYPQRNNKYRQYCCEENKPDENEKINVLMVGLDYTAENAHTVVEARTISKKSPERDLCKNSLVIGLESKSAFVINENECQQLNTIVYPKRNNKYRQCCCKENKPDENGKISVLMVGLNNTIPNKSNNEKLSYKYPESSLYYDPINKKLSIEQQHCNISDISICHCIKFSFQQKSSGKLNHVRRKYSSA